jgi:hypothetical protein
VLSNGDRIGLIVRIANHWRGDPDLIWAQVGFVLDALGFDTSVQGLCSGP